eukprot:SM000239S08078  [mRNA]  locus=s239:147467:150425:- [translate_table: standard]
MAMIDSRPCSNVSAWETSAPEAALPSFEGVALRKRCGAAGAAVLEDVAPPLKRSLLDDSRCFGDGLLSAGAPDPLFDELQTTAWIDSVISTEPAAVMDAVEEKPDPHWWQLDLAPMLEELDQVEDKSKPCSSTSSDSNSDDVPLAAAQLSSTLPAKTEPGKRKFPSAADAGMSAENDESDSFFPQPHGAAKGGLSMDAIVPLASYGISPPAWTGLSPWKPTLSQDPFYVDRPLSLASVDGTSVDKQTKASSALLRNHLVAFAEAIATDDLQRSRFLLGLLKKNAKPLGDVMQRTAYLFMEALQARMLGESPTHSSQQIVKAKLTPTMSINVCDQMPFFKFSHMSATVAILDAVMNRDRIHILDMGSWQGGQWEALIRALAARPQGPPELRITCLSFGKESYKGCPRPLPVVEPDKQYCQLADSLGMRFSYNFVDCDLEQMTAADLLLDEGEALAVSAVMRLHTLADEFVLRSNPRDRVLRMIRRLNPAVVVLVEKHANGNNPFFLQRFKQTLDTYHTAMTAVDTYIPRNSEDRLIFERDYLGSDILNIVACEGLQRTRRTEYLPKWQLRFREAGFSSRLFKAKDIKEVKVVTEAYGKCAVEERNGALMLHLNNFPVMHTTAWQPSY